MTLHQLLRLKWLLFFVALVACSTSGLHVVIPSSSGTLHETLSVQVTSSKRKSVLFNNAAFAKLMQGPVAKELEAKLFEVAGSEAPQHLVVHVRDAGRGTGSVRFFCELSIFVYGSWPGELGARKNEIQNEDGSVVGQSPRLAATLRLENKKRARLGDGGELAEGAFFCAQGVARELEKLRQQTAPPPTRKEPLAADAEVKAPPLPVETKEASFEVVRRVSQGPGNLTWTPAGRLIVSLHQFYSPEYPVAEVDEAGNLSEFAAEAKLDSVLGIQSDENGVVWMLDNGLKSSGRARLVGYHSVRKKIVSDIDLSSVMPQDAFFNDLVIDLDHQYAYLADPAGGNNAALVVVDLEKHEARRVLSGHVSVIPEDLDLVIDGTPVEVLTSGGEAVRPRVGVNPIAADSKNEWLYFGPMHGLSLYRVPTARLRDAALSSGELAASVERFSDKPICDGISIDNAGNVFLGDLAENAIVAISPKGERSEIAKSSTLSWVDAFSFGPDGQLYAVVNQLHKSAPLHRGMDITRPPFRIIRVPVASTGVVGR